MKKTCVHCHNKVEDKYRVNELGDVFCDDDCYEQHDSDCNDAYHPYIDDYELMRSNYLDWLENWESDLRSVAREENILLKSDTMLDTIDEVFDEYWDYYKTEGDDGVFAQEIYQYFLKFKKLQKKILQWRPQRKILFYVSIEFDQDGFERVIDRWEVLAEFLQKIRATKLYKLLKDHVHPFDNMSFYFETEKQKDAALQLLEQTFNESIIDIFVDQAHQCDGCEDIEVISDVNVKRQNGWFFCDSCEREYLPGFFTKKSLLNEIQLCDEDNDLWKRAKKVEWHYYIRKIKRSCRYHNVDFPDWIELEYL